MNKFIPYLSAALLTAAAITNYFEKKNSNPEPLKEDFCLLCPTHQVEGCYCLTLPCDPNEYPISNEFNYNPNSPTILNSYVKNVKSFIE